MCPRQAFQLLFPNPGLLSADFFGFSCGSPFKNRSIRPSINRLSLPSFAATDDDRSDLRMRSTHIARTRCKTPSTSGRCFGHMTKYFAADARNRGSYQTSMLAITIDARSIVPVDWTGNKARTQVEAANLQAH
jgi:hypothetical protein